MIAKNRNRRWGLQLLAMALALTGMFAGTAAACASQYSTIPQQQRVQVPEEVHSPDDGKLKQEDARLKQEVKG